jgi:hypothetical protein
MEPLPEPSSALETAFDGSAEVAGASSFGRAPAWMALSAMAATTISGAGLGLVLEALQPDLPFAVPVLLLGGMVAALTAVVLAKIEDLPPGLIAPRVLPALALGLLVGVYTWGLWWSFDPASSWLAVGATAGFFAGTPVAFSFGLAGGKSRPLGMAEWTNILTSAAVALVFGFLFGIDDPDMIPGIAGGLGLISSLFAGRANLWQLLAALNTGSD